MRNGDDRIILGKFGEILIVIFDDFIVCWMEIWETDCELGILVSNLLSLISCKNLFLIQENRMEISILGKFCLCTKERNRVIVD